MLLGKFARLFATSRDHHPKEQTPGSVKSSLELLKVGNKLLSSFYGSIDINDTIGTQFPVSCDLPCLAFVPRC